MYLEKMKKKTNLMHTLICGFDERDEMRHSWSVVDDRVTDRLRGVAQCVQDHDCELSGNKYYLCLIADQQQINAFIIRNIYKISQTYFLIRSEGYTTYRGQLVFKTYTNFLKPIIKIFLSKRIT